ncbi:interleukin-17C [Dendropsophus ebraccatus]|uniref:interleukin-17C n=1 Tax=Dendropsophus ebraccatus TaxID=150705 RepID=UPI0038319B95
MHSLWVIILLAVFSVGVCHAKHKPKKHPHHHSHRNPESIYCFSENDLENSPSEVVGHFVSSKMHWDRYPAVNLVNNIEDIERRRKRRKRTPEATCPQYSTLERGQSLNERSISPWTYRIDTDESRYPQKLAYAHCLCNHCISSKTGKESSSLNSVPVSQTMLVLRKKTCPYESTLSTFVLEYISVPVACTCAVPRY